MHTAGKWLLTLWSGLNALIGLAVTALVLRGAPPPALLMLVPEAQLPSIDARAVAVVNAQAALANPLIVAVCALVLVLVWSPARQRAGLTLALVLLPVQALGFVSDAFLGHHNLAANVVSTLVLSVGLAAFGLGRRAASA